MRTRFRSIIYLLPHLVRTWLVRPITVRYPFAPLELSPYFRGRVVIDAERCQGCGACVRDCPAFGLLLEREDRHTFRLIHYPDRCACCGQCEASCTSGAIRQTNAFVPGGGDREAMMEVLVQAKGEGDATAEDIEVARKDAEVSPKYAEVPIPLHDTLRSEKRH